MDDTLLTKGAIKQRMKCSGAMATRIEKTFVTVEQLLEQIESDQPLSEIEDIGPETELVIEDWYDNRDEREEHADTMTVEKKSARSLVVKNNGSWKEALEKHECPECENNDV